jgi:hypothetical protein
MVKGMAWRKLVKERGTMSSVGERLKEMSVAQSCLLSSTYRRRVLTTCITFTSYDIGEAGSKTASPITGDIGDVDCKRRRGF